MRTWMPALLLGLTVTLVSSAQSIAPPGPPPLPPPAGPPPVPPTFKDGPFPRLHLAKVDARQRRAQGFHARALWERGAWWVYYH